MSLVKVKHKKHLINVLFVAVKEFQMTYKCTSILIQKSSYLADLQFNIHNICRIEQDSSVNLVNKGTLPLDKRMNVPFVATLHTLLSFKP